MIKNNVTRDQVGTCSEGSEHWTLSSALSGLLASALVISEDTASSRPFISHPSKRLATHLALFISKQILTEQN